MRRWCADAVPPPRWPTCAMPCTCICGPRVTARISCDRVIVLPVVLPRVCLSMSLWGPVAHVPCQCRAPHIQYISNKMFSPHNGSLDINLRPLQAGQTTEWPLAHRASLTSACAASRAGATARPSSDDAAVGGGREVGSSLRCASSCRRMRMRACMRTQQPARPAHSPKQPADEHVRRVSLRCGGTPELG